mmetsp:Transcript_33521/g.39392  ORF Transcript_33521/g.39392 Transcript_33521/m.39392 type:complete len:365 (+) Transcript_33521:1-1095(+)
MDESIRRLTMVMRAALSVASAFTFDNHKNQELLFTHLPYLEKLSIPVSSKTLEHSQGYHSFTINDQEWTHELAVFAHLLISCILHKNSDLCNRVHGSLLNGLFSSMEESEDLSTVDTLDVIFILMKPGRAPNSEVQIQACKYFMLLRTRGLADSVAMCMKTVAVDKQCVSTPSPTSPKSPSMVVETDFPSMMKVEQCMRKPARFLNLLTSLMEGGNETVAQLLNSSAGLTIDLTSATIVSLVTNRLLKIGKSDDLNTIAEDGGEIEKNEVTSPTETKKKTRKINLTLKPPNTYVDTFEELSDPTYSVLLTISEEDSVGSALFKLLIEQISLSPLTPEQIFSNDLWSFLEKFFCQFWNQLANHVS